MNLHPEPLKKPFVVKDAWLNITNDIDCPHITDRFLKYWDNAKQGEIIGKYKSTTKLCVKKSSPTLTKSEGNGGVFHPTERRAITTNERKRLGSYPHKFKFTNWKNAIKRIGNSVPPLFMRSISANVHNILFNGNVSLMFDENLTYPEILEIAWNEHLAPRAKNAPTVISTFAGGGGSSLGYSMAGYKELLAVEWDNNAVETFKLNFPDVPVYHGDISKLSVKQCMKLAGLKNEGELDLLDGSPPCQGFSVSGKRDFSDNRNLLFNEYVRLLRGLKPKVFIMENVKGLVIGKMKLIFADIMRELKASGYNVVCKLMNAKYFYVPQVRNRLIFIGVRNDIHEKYNDHI